MKGNNASGIFEKIKNTGWVIKFRSFFAEDFFKSHISVRLLVLNLLFNLIDWSILFIYIKPVDFPIILHYNVYFGVDMLGEWQQVYLLPVIGLFLFIVNFSLSVYFYRGKERIASYLLLMAGMMIQLSLIIASVSVIIINY